MESKNNRPLSNLRYTIAKKDIVDFVNSLHKVQEDYIESAVRASGYKEDNVVIQRIMEMK